MYLTFSNRIADIKRELKNKPSHDLDDHPPVALGVGAVRTTRRMGMRSLTLNCIKLHRWWLFYFYRDSALVLGLAFNAKR